MPTPDQIQLLRQQRLQFLTTLCDILDEEPEQQFPNLQQVTERAGLPSFGVREYKQIIEPLAADGLVKGLGTGTLSGASTFLRLTITPEGRKQVEARTAGAEDMPASPSLGNVTVNLSGTGNNFNMQNASPGASQTVTQSTQVSDVRDWSRQVRQAVAEADLDDSDRSEVIRELDNLDDELTEPEPRKRAVKRFGTAVLNALIKASAAATATAAEHAFPVAAHDLEKLIEMGQHVIS